MDEMRGHRKDEYTDPGAAENVTPLPDLGTVEKPELEAGETQGHRTNPIAL
jgi:hypothetical protein